MTEGQIQKQAIELLKLSGYLVFRLNAGRQSNKVRPCPPGTPDLLAVKNGRVLWLEIKKPGEKLRDTQQVMISDLIHHGQEVAVVSGILELQEMI